MLNIPARTIYVDPAIRDRANCARRLERMLPHFACDDVRELGETTLEEIRAIGKRRHGKDDFGDEAVIAFTTYEPHRDWWHYHLREGDTYVHTQGRYCQTAVELNIVDGCVFRCAYCGFGRYVVIPLDVERLIEGLDGVFAAHPNQRLWKYSNMTDLPPFEPEYDAIPPMVRRFAREDGRYLMLFTKSDNVDFLLDLDHRGRTMISWSISCDTSSRLVDRRAATMDERIAAMARAQQAGYIVRARLSPIVPVRNWRAEHRELFRRLFDACTPDLVTLELLGWFDCEDLPQLIPADMLDADALAAAEAAADRLRGVKWGPFPEALHQEIYGFCAETVRELSPDTPVSFCHGTPATWQALGERVGQAPPGFICNCGGMSAPGGSVYDRLHAGRGS